MVAKLSTRQYQSHLELSHSHLDSLLEDTSSTLDLLSSLSNSFKTVEAQTTAFQKQCEGILQEQSRITELASNLDKNLKYYNVLEPVTRRLNAPGAGSFVRSKEFSDMLSRLDQCLEYMAVHVCSPTVLSRSPSDFLANASRGSHLPFTLSLAADQGLDIDPCSLCWRLARDRLRRDASNC